MEHIEEVKKKLAMQCGIVSKLRHYIPKSVFFQFYSSNIRPIWCADLLMCKLYRPSTFSSIAKKILRLILFRKYTENVTHFFEKYKVLAAHELHIYELLKFVMKSKNKMHTDTYLNELFSFESRSNIQQEDL